MGGGGGETASDFDFSSFSLLVSTALGSSGGSCGRGYNNSWDVGEVEVAEQVLGLLVDGDFDDVEFGVLGHDVIFPLTLLFLELEGNATDGTPKIRWVSEW